VESVIKALEFEISQDYEMFKNNPDVWGYSFQNSEVPNRNSKNFVDMALARLVMKYGFSKGSYITFELEQYLKGIE